MAEPEFNWQMPPEPENCMPPEGDKSPEKPGIFLTIGTVLALLVLAALNTLDGLQQEQDLSQLVGYVVGGTLLLPLIVVAILCIWKGMRNARTLTMAYVVVVLIGIVAKGSALLNVGATRKPRPPLSTSASGAQSASNWDTFTPEDGGFAVELPGELDLESSPSQKRMLGDRLNQATADLPAGGSITVTWSPGLLSDAALAPQMIATVRDSILRGSNGSLFSERDIALQGHPGAEFMIHGKLNGKSGTIWVRCYIVGQDYYQINWVSTGKHVTPNQDAERVFESFRLLRQQM